jgi:hypothetical protein
MRAPRSKFTLKQGSTHWGRDCRRRLVDLNVEKRLWVADILPVGWTDGPVIWGMSVQNTVEQTVRTEIAT